MRKGGAFICERCAGIESRNARLGLRREYERNYGWSGHRRSGRNEAIFQIADPGTAGNGNANFA